MPEFKSRIDVARDAERAGNERRVAGDCTGAAELYRAAEINYKASHAYGDAQRVVRLRQLMERSAEQFPSK